MNTTKKLEGVIPAIITPLQENGNLDLSLLEKQVDYLASAGVDGFFVNGSTGEGAYLSTQEKIETVKLVRQTTEGQQFLCVACLKSSTAEVLEEIQAFENLEPDFIVAVTPYYYGVPQDIIVQHYKEIARRSPAPVIVYNIPSCTHNPISLDTVFELTAVDNIVGIKDSSGDFMTFSRGVLTENPSQFLWIQGIDYLDAPSLTAGANGIVTGLGNVWIEPYIEMYRESKNGNSPEVYQAQKQINALYKILRINSDKTTIPAIKAAAMLLGRSSKWTKIPGLAFSEVEIAKVKEVLLELKLL